ncbi:hypothetical protein [Priestia megaterium]|uniref:hypothetical protein n=1 Tax=Priestia megaterium TaxID=1404 RepID=UPI001375753F|nr:hypothetical protein [Priestia megaterium]
MITFENIVVPLSKSCSDSIIQQAYLMNYMQSTLNELQNSKVIRDALENYESGVEE